MHLWTLHYHKPSTLKLLSALNESLQLSHKSSAHFVKCLQCNVQCAVQSHFPPVQIVLLLIVFNMMELIDSTMELTIDETLPQPLLPRVDGQVVEAELVTPTCACIFDNQGQSN